MTEKMKKLEKLNEDTLKAVKGIPDHVTEILDRHSEFLRAEAKNLDDERWIKMKKAFSGTGVNERSRAS